MAGSAGRLLGHGHRDLRSLHRRFEAELDLRLEIPAAGRFGVAAAPAEDAGEDVAEIADADGEAAGSRAAATAESAEHPAGVELLALLRVLERVVGATDFLESLLGPRVVGVAIRVQLARELSVGPLDLVVGRLAVDTEDLIWIACAIGPCLAADHDSRRTNHVVVDAVALLEGLEHGAGVDPVGRAGRDRLVEHRVEPLADGVVGDDAGTLEPIAELAVDQRHAGGERVAG